MPLVFGKSLYLHTLFFTVISLKTYRIDMSKILIIDDEVQIRTLLTRMMELEGYDAVSYTHLTLPTKLEV